MSIFQAAERPITFHEACGIRLLLFGRIDRTFDRAWLKQGLWFNTRKPLYRLQQKRGGPCGVISAIQAFVMYDMLFSENKLEGGGLRDFKPNPRVRRESLVRAMVSILMQNSECGKTVLVWRGRSVVLGRGIVPDFKRDRNMEYLNVRSFLNQKDLEDFLKQHVDHYMDDSNGGVATFLYSVLLTKGVENVYREMDNIGDSLIGNEDGFCAQELVNMFLVGQAVSNVFDGNELLDDGVTVCKGIPCKSKIGFLSMYSNALKNGSFYKSPRYPIWVLNTVNHYSTLCGASMDVLETDETFSLIYIDSMSRRNHEIRLIINPTGGANKNSCDVDTGNNHDNPNNELSSSNGSSSSSSSTGNDRRSNCRRSRNKNSNSSSSSSSDHDNEEYYENIRKCVLSRWPKATVEFQEN